MCASLRGVCVLCLCMIHNVCACVLRVCVGRDAKTRDRAELRRYWRISMLLAGVVADACWSIER